MTCPISLIQILQANLRPMTHGDYEGFAGVEGSGYIAEITHDGGDYVVVADALDADGGEIVVQVFGDNDHDDKNGTWEYRLPMDATQIC